MEAPDTTPAPALDRLDRLRQTAEAAPDRPAGWNALGIALAQAKRAEDAAEAFRRAIAADPGYARGHNNLGNALQQLGRKQEALVCYDRALECDPSYGDARENRIRLRLASGDRTGAITDLRLLAQRSAPGDVAAQARIFRLGAECARWDIAAQAARRLTRLRPDDVEAWRMLAQAEQNRGNQTALLAARRRVVFLDPARKESQIALGQSLLRCGEPLEARFVLEDATRRWPDDADGWYWLGNACIRLEQHEKARACYQKVAALEDPAKRAHFAEATTLIQQGNWKEGWALYDGRYGLSAFKPRIPVSREGLWRGDALTAKTILIHAEQGFGDTIMAARFLPLLKERFGAARVELLAEKELRPLLEPLDCLDAFHSVGEKQSFTFHRHLPMLSLPQRCGALPDDLPNAPYLAAPAGKPAPDWAGDPRLKIGIVWAGRPTHSDDRYRSIPLRQLAPVMTDPKRLVISLQMGQARNALAVDRLAQRANLIDHGRVVQDFGDSAAAIAALDLLITVDTAAAHLAGAMGKPVWMLLSMGAEWRWGFQGNTTPWYPSMRLYRQRPLTDWEEAMERLMADLRSWRPAD